MIADVIKRAQLEGVELYLENDQLKYRVRQGRLSAELKQELIAQKAMIVSLLREQAMAADAAIPVAPRTAPLQCSFAQQRLWFVDQLEGGSAQYNIPAALRLKGHLDEAALQGAVDAIVARHEIVRTVYRAENGEAVQVVRPARPLPIRRVDLSSLDREAREERVQALAREEAEAAFRLSEDLMLRVGLLTLGDDEHVLLFTMHHIASDGWSMGVLIREFVTIYGAILRGEADPLPPLPIQYADYAQWQRARGGALQTQLGYWKERLSGIPQLHSVPLDKARGPRQSYVAQRYQQRVERPLADALQQLARRHDATLFMVLQSAFATLLSRWSGANDIVMAVPTAGRTTAEIEPLIGFFINTLVFRTQLSSADTFHDLVERAKRDTLDAYANQHVPFEMLVEELKPERALSYNPLCQIKFVLQNHRNHAEAATFQLPGLEIENVAHGVERIRFDLDLTASESANGLHLNWSFKDDLFELATIERMAESFRVLLGAIVAAPETPIARLPLLSEPAEAAMLAQSRGVAADAGRDRCVHRLFEEQAERTPDTAAIHYGDTLVTYRELDEKANRLAHSLQEQGVEPGARVGLYLERSPEVLIGLLGILKAGATYVPFEPSNTAERLRHIIANGQIECVLTQSSLVHKLPVKGIDVVLLDDAATDAGWLAEYPAQRPETSAQTTLDGSAYVIYTSGSTGVPKGVEIPHAGLADYCAYASERYYEEGITGSLVVTSHGFDITVPSLYVPLLRGGCVTLTTPGEELSELATALGSAEEGFLLRMTPMHVTGLLSLLTATSPTRHVFVIGGEAFSASLARELQGRFPNAQIYNHYGPTETVVGCAMFDATANLDRVGERLPIGRPMANTELYVVNEAMQLAPTGVPGELCIGGAGVAKGYVNQPELTAAKFVGNPFGAGRVYRSGDLVRYLPGGDLEFLGRLDDQIKIRGFRIELGEIETALKSDGSVKDALVVAQGEGETKALVAYVVSEAADHDSLVSALKMRLKQALPEYMVPAGWCVLEAFPLNANGKIDRKALPSIDRQAGAVHVAPSTETERRLAEIWQEVLKLEAPLSVTANFFELGGHSLLATRVVSAVSHAFHKSMPVRTLFEHSSVQALAAYLDAQAESGPVAIRKAPRAEPRIEPATPMQQGLYFHALLDKSAYITQVSPIFRGALDLAAFRAAWQEVIARHDALRTAFTDDDGAVIQRIAAEADVAWHQEDLSALASERQKETIEAWRRRERATGFDFAQPGLHRVALFQLGDARAQLVWSYHNLILDMASASRVLGDVLRIGRSAEPEAIAVPQSIAGGDAEAAKRFWREALGDVAAPTRIPLPQPDAPSSGTGALSVALTSEETAAIDAFAQANGVTIETALQLAWGILLHRYSGENDVVFGAVDHGRTADTGARVGVLTNVLPLRLAIAERAHPAEQLRRLHGFRAAAMAQGALPLADIQQQSGVPAGTSLFDSLVIFEPTSLASDLARDAAAASLALEACETDDPTYYPLSITACVDDALKIECRYAAESFAAAAVQRMIERLALVLAQLPRCIDVDAIDLVTGAERAQIALWNGERAEAATELCVHERFEALAAAQPEAIALEFNDERLTYAELNAAANRLAHDLIARGVGPDTLVGIAVKRSPEMIISLLAVWKAGGAYVPLDPSYPAARLEHMVSDSAMPIVLTQAHVTERLLLGSAEAVIVDRRSTAQPDTNPDGRRRGLTAANLAYVIYTSGTTGKPKGVLIEHRHVQSQFAAIHARYRQPQRHRVFSVCSFNFDVFIDELCLSLLAGGTLVLTAEGLSGVNAEQFWRFVADKEITAMSKSTAYVHYLCSELTAEQAAAARRKLRLVVAGGEALAAEHVARWQRLMGTGVALWNAYGPTECTVTSTVYEVTRYPAAGGKNPPIGRPLPNYTCHVVGARGAFCPVDVPGELWVGGGSIARGYLHRDELTALRFVAHPETGERLYRTGDLVRWLPGGELEYLGRIDEQVKIRGFRVELGEIEAAIGQHPLVGRNVVVMRDRDGDASIVAYVVPLAASAEHDLAAELRDALRRTLPDYMVPSAFVVMDRLPLTPNGKIDKRALPAPDRQVAQAVHVAPATPAEVQLAQIWQALLKLDREVSATASFFELGGHSLLAMRVATAVAGTFGKHVPVSALFENNTVRKLARYIDEEAGEVEHVAIARSEHEEAIPLSFAQQRLWFINQLEGASAQYNMPMALRLTGALDVDVVQRALNEIVRRHEIVRTTYHARGGAGVQVVSPYRPLPMLRVDLSGWDAAMQEAEVERLAAEQAAKTFDLTRDFMLRVGLITLSPREHVLLFAMHHIASDGWSMGVLAREFTTLYEAFANGTPSPLPPLEIQYADYARWQREHLGADTFERQLGYWKRQLEDVPQVHSLPLDRPRAAVRSLEGASLRQQLSLETLQRLRQFAQSQNVTLFMLLQTSFALLLGRWSNEHDIVVGTPTAGRTHKDLEPLIGFFVNTLLLRSDVSGAISFTELLDRNQRMALDAFSNQDIAFEALVDEIKPERNLSYTTMFQITFNLDNTEKSALDLAGIEVTPITKSQHIAKFDMNFGAAETPEGLALSWGYASSLFHAATIERMAASFAVLLDSILENPAEDIRRLRTAPAADLAAVREWNRQKADFPTDRCIHEIFEEHVRRAPGAVAVVRGGESLTYAEINRRANRLARHLIERGVRAESFVGVCVERSFDMVVAMVAILKAGGAYVPLDPNYPAARIRTILDDCRASLVLTQEHLADALRGSACEIAFIDDAALAQYAGDDLPAAATGVTSSSLAHLIYTSGSTGKPKGVMIEHLGVVRLVAGNHYVPFNAETRMLQVSTCTFDAATWEIWGALLNGGQLILYPERVIDLAELNEQIDAHAVNTILLTAGLFEQWSHQLPKGGSLRYLLSGGDVVSPAGVSRIYRELPQVEIINAYGPTENAVISCCYTIPRDADFRQALPIGHAINGTTLYVLNDAMTPLPIGAVGELYVGGAGVARGYWNQPELTEQKFVTAVLDAGVPERLYKTGDLVRYLPDGALEFIGRADDQVKIRGFRIEPGEIATRLLRFGDVKDALVLARGQGTNKKLVAYVIGATPELDADELKQRLRQELPEYMVPAAIVMMEAFPLNSSGKVDRKALPEPEFQQNEAYVAPRTDIERRLATIWQELLKADRVSIDDNFFAIGGDSILSIQAVSRANQAGIAITTRQLFEHQTIAALAAQARQGVTVEAPQEAVIGDLELLPIQRKFLRDPVEGKHHFNQSVLLVTPAAFRFAFVEEMVAAVYRRHDALRLRFTQDAGGEWTAAHAPLTDEMLAASCVVETLPSAAEERAAFITARCDHWQRQFDLAAGPLFRVIHFEGGGEGRLFLLAHHIVVDGVSWRILLADIERAWEQFQAGRPIDLGAKTSSFQQWGAALADYASTPALAKEKAYWLAQYDHPVPPLPVDRTPADAPTTASTRRERVRLTAAETQALLQRSGAAYRTSINELLLSGLYLGMQQWTGASAMRVALEGHGRETLFESLDTTQTVGWFTTVYPLTLHSRGGDVADVIKAVKEQYRALPDNGIGFGILRHVARDADLAAFAAGEPQIVFNYLGQFDQSVNAETAFQAAAESTGASHGEEQPRPYSLVFNGKVAGGELAFAIDYSDLQYRPDTIAALARSIEGALRAIIDHCTSIERGDYTPSDFPLARVSQERLDEWQRAYPSLTKLYPATAMQQGMYFHALLDRSAYVTQIFPILKGRLSTEHFRKAWETVANRHDVFRTAFAGAEEQLHQLVVAGVRQPWHEEDWRALSPDEQAQRFEQARLADHAAGFDLGRAPLQRVSLFRLSEDRYQLLWTHHHILLDGWSVPRVFREVMLAYQALSKGNAPALEAPSDFESYMRWLNGRDVDEAYAYWREVLGDFETATPLGIDRLPAGSGEGTVLFDFDAAESQALEAYARSQQTTLNTVMQLAWATLLHRYSGEDDVVFGSLVSGRPAEVAGIESMVGLFINMIPVKVSFRDSATTASLLARIQSAFQASQQHGYLPLPVIQRQSGVRAGEPLFETIVAFENYPLDNALSHDAPEPYDFTIEKSQAEEGRTNFKLVLVGSYRANLRIRCDYGKQFSRETIVRLMEHLKAILRQLPEVERPGSIDILSAAERELFAAVNDTKTGEPNDCFAHELFEAHAAARPAATAVTCRDRHITYDALNRSANRLARHLVETGVRPGSVVALCVERSIEELTAILAVWKAGAAFVPLDPSYPESRIRTMLDDSGAAVILTQSHLRERLGSASAPVVALDRPEPWQERDSENVGVIGAEPVSDRVAYIIYTSGSTGMPKGVPNTHAGLANLCAWHRRKYGTGPASAGSHMASISFDASILEVWPYLLAGGRIAIVSDAERAEALLLAARLKADRVTDVMFPTALLEHVAHQDVPPSEWEHVRLILAGGDRLGGYCVPNGSTAKLANLYGPTEAAVVTTSFDVDPTFSGAPPIGRPIDNFTIHVLDRERRHVPVGIAGELHVGGVALAKGYLDRPELTAERFIANPFAGDASERLYRTGDLVRMLPDGNLEFVGRIDDQVKVRGFRIELGEIVARILQSPEVSEAVVVARGDGHAKQLVAYVVPAAAGDERALVDSLRQELGRQLPDYMVPAAFVVMTALPLNGSGKVDRKALPAPEWQPSSLLAPRTATESAIVSIFEELLGYAPAGTDDNFFERGGHSLLASQAIARIRRRCDVDVPLVALFEIPTPAGLARLIEETRGTLPAATAIEPLRDYANVPLTFAQQRLYFIEQYEQGTTSYNIDLTFKVRGDFRPELFVEALRVVSRRQWSLRTHFRVDDAVVRQEILDDVELPVRICEQPDAAAVLEALRFERKLPFDIAGGLLWRATVYCVGESEHWINITFHHAITDGWSHNLFKREIVQAYVALARGEEPAFEPMPLQYADYAAWQRATLDEARLEQLLAHWTSTLRGMPKQHSLPLDRRRPQVFARKGGAVPFEIDAATVERLKELCARSGVTLYMALVAAFSVLVSRLSGKEDVVIGTPMANRPSPELERVIGFFVNTVVLRVGVDGRSSFGRLVEAVRGVTLDAQEHQELPFDRLVAELQPERGSAAHPLFQLCFVLNNTPAASRDNAGFDLEMVEVDEHASMFDLMLTMNDFGDRLTGNFSFDAELFDKSTVEGFAAKFRKLLGVVTADPKQRIESIELAEKIALSGVKRVRR